MNLSEPFIRRPVMTAVLTVSVIVFGVLSYFRLPVNDLPVVDYPVISVQANYPGASPDTVANNIATPLERQFMQINGLELVTSQSTQGHVSFTLQFALNKSIDAAATDVQTAISQATGNLPTDLPSPPTYSKTNPNDQPILYIALTSDSITPGKLYDYGSTQVGQRISILPGVSSVLVFGTKSAVRIKVDPSLMWARGISIDDLVDSVKNGTSYAGVGQFDSASGTELLRPNGQLDTAQSYGNLIVSSTNGAPVYLHDVADVQDTVQDERIKMRFWVRGYGEPAATVVVAVNRQAGSNAVAVSKSVRDLLPMISAELPASIRVTPIYDRSQTIVNSVDDVQAIGAAAQYGSDAISGVMNIILDKEPNGLTFTETGGSTYTQGAELAQETISYGTALPNGGFAHFALEGKLHNPSTSSAAPFPATFGGKPNYYYPSLSSGQSNPLNAATYNYVPENGYGRSNRDIIIGGSYNAELPLGHDAAIYSFSTFYFRDVKDARGNFDANNINSLPQIYPNGFQAYRRIWEWDGQAALGARAKLGGWDWDLSTSYGRDDAKLGAENTLNPSLGPASPTSFRMGEQIVDLWVNNLDATRSFNVGLPAPVQVSPGVEHRWEQFQNLAGEPDSYINGGYIIPNGSSPFNSEFGGQAPSPGLVSFTGTSPADAASLHRNNVATYLDLFTNLTKNWYVGTAGRVEHYDDSAGNTVSGKVSTRYEILPGLAVRGGVNNGFRAPSLGQTGLSTTQYTATNIDGVNVATTSKFLPVDSPAAIALGAQPLKPEKSLNYSLGVTYEPFRALRLTVDGYQVQLTDRIVKTDFIGTANNGGAAVQAILASQGITGVNSAQFFTNAINTTTWGTDIVGEYTLRTESLGTIRPSAALSYATTQITHVIPNPPQLTNINVVLFGRQGQIDLVNGSPRSKVILGIKWDIWRFKNTVRLTRYDGYTEASTTAGFDLTYSPKWITDLDIEYAIADQFSLAAGAYNLFNVYPDSIGPPAVTGATQYGSFSPFGLTGGFYYARLKAQF